MQFTNAIVFLAAVAGVSANVHSTCFCTKPTDGSLAKDVTSSACANYPKDKVYNSQEKVIDSSSVIIEVDGASSKCVSKDKASGAVAAHLGGNEFEIACQDASPAGQTFGSTCE